MRRLVFAVVLVFCALASARDRIVPVDREPALKVVLKNEYIEVIHAVLLAGERTMFHRHSHNRLAVILSEAIVKEDVPGKASTQTQDMHAGSVSVAEYAKKPYTHRLENVGKTVFDVLDIEFLKRPDGLSAAPIAAPAAEDAAFRAYRWELAPGASTPVHTHLRPYLIIAATPMQLGMMDPGGAAMEHPIKAGDFHWIDGKVTHTLINKGKEAGILFEVELK